MTSFSSNVVVTPMLNAIEVAKPEAEASFVVAALVHVNDVPAITVQPLWPDASATVSLSETASKVTALPFAPFAAMLLLHVIVVVPVGKPTAPAVTTNACVEVALALCTFFPTPLFTTVHVVVAVGPPVAQIAVFDVIVSVSPTASSVVMPMLKTIEVAMCALLSSFVVAALIHVRALSVTAQPLWPAASATLSFDDTAPKVTSPAAPFALMLLVHVKTTAAAATPLAPTVSVSTVPPLEASPTTTSLVDALQLAAPPPAQIALFAVIVMRSF
jgi:hypothetical protein